MLKMQCENYNQNIKRWKREKSVSLHKLCKVRIRKEWISVDGTKIDRHPLWKNGEVSVSPKNVNMRARAFVRLCGGCGCGFGGVCVCVCVKKYNVLESLCECPFSLDPTGSVVAFSFPLTVCSLPLPLHYIADNEIQWLAWPPFW